VVQQPAALNRSTGPGKETPGQSISQRHDGRRYPLHAKAGVERGRRPAGREGP
jgi:hypothetical protein